MSDPTVSELQNRMRTLLTKAKPKFRRVGYSVKQLQENSEIFYETYDYEDTYEFYEILGDITTYPGEHTHAGEIEKTNEPEKEFISGTTVNEGVIDTLSRVYILLGTNMSEAGKIHSQEEFIDEMGVRYSAAKFLIEQIAVEDLVSEEAEFTLRSVYDAAAETIISGDMRPINTLTGNGGHVPPGEQSAMEEAERKGQFGQGGQPSEGEEKRLTEEDLTETIKDWLNKEGLSGMDFKKATSVNNAARDLAREIIGR